MAISRKKSEGSEVTKPNNHDIKVTRAKDIDSAIMFDMVVNDVTIYGCAYRELERKDGSGSFAKISFPSKKSGDNWYNQAFVKLSDEDIKTIEKQIEELI